MPFIEAIKEEIEQIDRKILATLDEHGTLALELSTLLSKKRELKNKIREEIEMNELVEKFKLLSIKDSFYKNFQVLFQNVSCRRFSRRDCTH